MLPHRLKARWRGIRMTACSHELIRIVLLGLVTFVFQLIRENNRQLLRFSGFRLVHCQLRLVRLVWLVSFIGFSFCLVWGGIVDYTDHFDTAYWHAALLWYWLVTTDEYAYTLLGGGVAVSMSPFAIDSPTLHILPPRTLRSCRYILALL